MWTLLKQSIKNIYNNKMQQTTIRMTLSIEHKIIIFEIEQSINDSLLSLHIYVCIDTKC